MKSVLTTYAHAFTTSVALLTFGLGGSLCSSSATLADERQVSSAPIVRPQGWLVASYSAIENPMQEVDLRKERALLGKIVAKRTPKDVERFRWWATGGPAYRWNEIILDELQESFVTLPLAARHLALFHAALDDAVAVARHYRRGTNRTEAVVIDVAVKAPREPSANSLSPSAHAAAASAASEILAYLFPARAAFFAATAQGAMQTRLLAGVEYPTEVEAGRVIGRKIAELAIGRGKIDGSDAKWSGSVPEGPGRWKGSKPITPLAGTWKTWVLANADEFRPPAPPAFDSQEVKAALRELKEFARTPKSNHRAVFWEVHGGARAHTLWNELARTKLLESGVSPEAGARVLATLNVAFADAGVACWDAKYAFWYARPHQLDPELKSLFPPPNHPSYPAAHGCLSTAAATVLAGIFQYDRERLVALGKEAAEARIWAGIHYRFDIDSGQEVGRKVAQKTLQRAYLMRAH